MHVKSINVVKEFKFCTIGVIIHLFSQIKIHLLNQKNEFSESIFGNKNIRELKENYKVYRQLDHDFHVSSIENECISIKNTFMLRSILKGRFFLFFVLSVSSFRCEVIKLFTCSLALFSLHCDDHYIKVKSVFFLP
jgi:hypothetical protein